MARNVALLIVVGAVVVPATAAIAARPFIEGGTPATEGQFPWMAWVKYGGAPNSYEDSCSGTVVAPKVVLTAGHCVYEFEAGNFTVVSGTVNRLSGGTRSAVTQAIPYPGFKYGCGVVCGHDAGLLILSSRVTTTPIPMAASPGDAALIAAGNTAYQAGWGLTSPNGTEIPESLYWTSTTIQCVGPAECEDPSVPYSIVTGNPGPKGPCEGDSGGPLWAESAQGPVEVGLTSRGPAGACNSTVSTRVDEIEPWIEEHVAAVSTVACTAESGTLKLSPGLSATAAVQTVKIKATLSGCSGAGVTGGSYTATLTTGSAVSCSVLTGGGGGASGPAKYKWAASPKAKPSTGTVSLALSEAVTGIPLSGAVTAGTFSSLSLGATGVSEKFAGGPTCGQPQGTKPAKPVKQGEFSGAELTFG